MWAAGHRVPLRNDLADTTYAGQLNVSDWFTQMVLSMLATGIAPGSFYQLDADGNRQRAHFDALPVEFIAERSPRWVPRWSTGSRPIT